MVLDRDLAARATALAAKLVDLVAVYQCGVCLFNVAGANEAARLLAIDARAELLELVPEDWQLKKPST